MRLAVGGVSYFGQILCEAEGGVWRHTENNSYGEADEYCDKSVSEAPANGEGSEENVCFVSRVSYNWSYDNYQSSSGTGGLTCNARFLLENNSGGPVRVILYSSWNNNAMSSNGWDTYSVEAGGEWETRVNRTNYTDGVITYDRVEKILVVRDLQECAGIFPADNPKAVWESLALPVDELPCPQAALDW